MITDPNFKDLLIKYKLLLSSNLLVIQLLHQNCQAFIK